MVNVLLKGRIGNNLFQIAAGVSLAKRNYTDVCFYTGSYYAPFPDNCSLYDYLQQFKSNILRNVTIKPGTPDFEGHYEEEQYAYTAIPYKDNSLVEGFFQSERYFEKETVRQIFDIDDDSKAYITQKYGHLLKTGITSINVRRGDYFKELDNHCITSMSFFKKAIKRIGKDKNYLLISDDIAWCKKMFRGKNFFFVEGEKPIFDLYIQTQCTNNIISNSSFSWWAAWLNNNPDKIVICPNPWFGVAKQHYDTSDLIPPEWIQLKNRMPLHLTFLGYSIWWRRRLNYFFKSKLGK
jgi:hypothetical protein